MTVKVIKSYHNSKEFQVEVKQGVQSFRLDYSASKKEAEWYAKMFKLALRNHDAAKIAKRAS